MSEHAEIEEERDPMTDTIRINLQRWGNALAIAVPTIAVIVWLSSVASTAERAERKADDIGRERVIDRETLIRIDERTARMERDVKELRESQTGRP